MSKPILYWGSGSIPCWKPMIVLAEKGIEYESKQISFSEKGHKGKEVTDLNPRGQVPTFKDGDAIVNESSAVCFYLEMTKTGKKLIPDDQVKKAKVLQKAFEASENLNIKQQGILYYYFTVKEEDRDPEEIKKKLDTCREELTIWENYLKKEAKPFVCGEEFTMADVFFFPFVAWAWRMSINFDKFPALNAYFNALKDRPSIKSTWPPHWNEGEQHPEKFACLKNM